MLAEHEGGDLPLPETVQGLIAARIDGLAPEEKALLQDASVIGKVFWPGALPARRRADPARARAEGVHPPRPPLLDRRRDAVRVPPRARPGRRLRPDPARGAGREAPARGRVARVARRRPHRGPRRDARPPLPRGALALSRGGRPRHDGATRAGATCVRRGRAARALAQRRRRGLRARTRGARADRAGAIRSGRRFSSSPPTAARDLADVDATGLLEEACEGFLAQGDVARAAEASQASPARRCTAATSHARSRRAGGRSSWPDQCRSPSRPPGRSPGGRANSRFSRARLTRRSQLAREVLAFADASGDERLADERARDDRARPRPARAMRAGSTTSSRPSCAASSAGAVSEVATTLNNLANCLWEVGRLDDSTARYQDARELCERYGLTAGISWHDAERVYDRDRHGDLEAAHRGRRTLPRPPRRGDELSDPARAGDAGARPARARSGRRGARRRRTGARRASARPGFDAQVASEILTVGGALPATPPDGAKRRKRCLPRSSPCRTTCIYDLPLHLVELGRGDEYLALTEGSRGIPGSMPAARPRRASWCARPRSTAGSAPASARRGRRCSRPSAATRRGSTRRSRTSRSSGRRRTSSAAALCCRPLRRIRPCPRRSTSRRTKRPTGCSRTIRSRCSSASRSTSRSPCSRRSSARCG